MLYELCSRYAFSEISNDVHTTYVPYRYREYKYKFRIAYKTRYDIDVHTYVVIIYERNTEKTLNAFEVR